MGDPLGAVVIVPIVIGVIGAVVAIWGVISHRAIARRRATLDFITRSEADGDLIKARKAFIELAKGPGGLAPYADEDKEKTDEAQSIRIVLNEFELISIGIQRGILDLELYRRWNKSGTIRHWKHAAPFVFALRARLKNDALFYEFEEMVRWLKDDQMPRRDWRYGLWFQDLIVGQTFKLRHYRPAARLDKRT